MLWHWVGAERHGCTVACDGVLLHILLTPTRRFGLLKPPTGDGPVGVYRPPRLNPTSMELDEKRAAGGEAAADPLSTQDRRRLKELKARWVADAVREAGKVSQISVQGST